MVWRPSQSDAKRSETKPHSPPKRRAGNLELSTSSAQPQRNERKGMSKGMSKGTLRRKTLPHLNLFELIWNDLKWFEAICDEAGGQLSAMTSKQHKRGHKQFTNVPVFPWLTVLSQWKPPWVLTSLWGFGFRVFVVPDSNTDTADLRCSHGRTLERCDVTSTGRQVV